MVSGNVLHPNINDDYKNITEWLGSQHNKKTGLELADAGIPVFPCNPDKTPATSHGFKDADTNSERIKLFFRRPNLLLGMPTGLGSNIDVIDEDPKNGGDLNTLGSLPMDVVAQTRSGGVTSFSSTATASATPRG